jgi:PAS domain S-box-containing protein
MPSNLSDWVPRHALGDNLLRSLRHGGFAIGVAVAYFLGARLSLALLTKPDGVAVFWPAAGISAGLLIAFGPGMRWPVAIGVTTATIAANILGDRNFGSAVVFALCNAGEALFIAWLIQRRFGSPFSLASVRNVLGFFGVVAVATAVSGIGGTAGFALFHNSGTPFLTTWLNWFASDALGVVTVAPLLIVTACSLNDRPPMLEVAEGLLSLAVLATVSVIGFGSSVDHWFTILPLSLLLPLLFWLAARCRLVFATAAIIILAITIVWTVTFGIGRLGDPSAPLVNRLYAAQMALLSLSVGTLLVAAVFGERRDHLAALENSNHRLQLALDCAELGTWSLHLKSNRFENDVRDRRIHGHGTGSAPKTLAEMRSQVHPDDLANLDAAFMSLSRGGDHCRAEYRLAPLADLEGTGRERWVAIEGAILRRASGRPVQLLGVTRDISEQKYAETKLRESERTSRELLGALPAAIFVTDAAGRITYCNEAAVNLWGAKPNAGDEKWFGLCRFYHANGAPMALEDCPTQIALTEGRAMWGAEAILERVDGSRIPIMPYPKPLRDEAGTIIGVINMTVDISERKKAELALAERNTQLALAGKVALVGSYAYDITTGKMQVAEGYAAIHGLPEGTTETTRSAWRSRVHPEDVERLELHRSQTFQNRQREYNVEYRIVGGGGGVRWIESRGFVSYDPDGNPQRVTGVNIDVTERKRVEDHQRVLVAELDHRVKNSLATIGAVVSHTLDTSSSMGDFAAALDGRVQSMARTHELLSASRWEGISVAELVRRELAPYATRSNTEIGGPDVILKAEVGQAMGMILHELATNAAKYGALSAQGGRVSIQWQQRLNGQPRSPLVLEWREIGGPPVAVPGKSGFGTRTIRDLVPYEFGGTVDLRFPPEGVECRLELPADWLSNDGESRPALANKLRRMSVLEAARRQAVRS